MYAAPDRGKPINYRRQLVSIPSEHTRTVHPCQISPPGASEPKDIHFNVLKLKNEKLGKSYSSMVGYFAYLAIVDVLGSIPSNKHTHKGS